MTYDEAYKIAREVFPSSWGDGEIGHAIWNYSGFPHFWDGNPEVCLREQLQEYLEK